MDRKTEIIMNRTNTEIRGKIIQKKKTIQIKK